MNLLSILANATEKTQQPFIKRAVSLYKKVKSSQNNISYYHNILQKLFTSSIDIYEIGKIMVTIEDIFFMLTKDIEEVV